MGIYEERIFPWFMDKAMSFKRVSLERARALREVRGEVLEIGVGTGLNVPHYSMEVQSLTAIDRSEGMLRRARRRAEASPLKVTLMQDDAEKLPFQDHRFDAVVSTWTLCTIPDARRALAEAFRVLRPEGRFVFLEHGRADNLRDRRLQNLFNPLNRCLSCGCNFNRDIGGLIGEAGFRIVELHRFVMPKTPSLLAFTAHLYRGTAVRQS